MVGLVACMATFFFFTASPYLQIKNDTMIILPAPKIKGTYTVEEVLQKRRSVRHFSNRPLTLDELSQLLWAGQGITNQDGLRTAPSAGATYPLELLVVVGNVIGISQGIYRYVPSKHSLIVEQRGDKRKDLYNASLRQSSILQAPCSLIITAIYERTTEKYGERGVKYVHMEVGHVSQNIYLQAEALNLHTVAIGAFFDDQVSSVLRLMKNEHPLYIMPIGR
ncbi:MAG: SagB/ThcOx family dehydrogenase [Bacteroidetes bacterium]|nr:SagB/ThcOx family dehydrogenase [Bacteroidota bacterium]